MYYIHASNRDQWPVSGSKKKQWEKSPSLTSHFAFNASIQSKSLCFGTLRVIHAETLVCLCIQQDYQFIALVIKSQCWKKNVGKMQIFWQLRVVRLVTIADCFNCRIIILSFLSSLMLVLWAQTSIGSHPLFSVIGCSSRKRVSFECSWRFYWCVSRLLNSKRLARRDGEGFSKAFHCLSVSLQLNALTKDVKHFGICLFLR